MKLFGRKGQGAMEYLMTYGWAILVVMIVGIVMWQLGIFSMGTTTVTASGFSKIKPQLAGTKLTTLGAFDGIFTNGAGSTIVITGVIVNNTMITGAPGCGPTGVTFNPSNTASAGDNVEIQCTAAGMGGSAGDVYTLAVQINYNITIGGITTTHSDRGTVRGPYE